VSELQTLGKLNTSLISLFACHTAAGKNVTGEGTFSLARGFAASGIPATITSMWTLDNKAAYSMAELFYKHVDAGESTSGALQLAKIELLHSKNGEYALPFFWAGTILLGPSQNFGDGKTEKPAPTNLILMAIGLAILGIGIVFVFRRGNRSSSSS
jgi:CHAT domain-containing protein